MNTSCLITGGAGFIGSHVADALLAMGVRVRILDMLAGQVHPDRKQPSYLSSQAEFIQGDIRNKAALDTALKGMDVVIHCAAMTGTSQSQYQQKLYADINVKGTQLLLDAMKKNGRIRRCVLPSSMMIYGNARALPIRPTAPVNPITPYAHTKATQEVLVHSHSLATGCEAAIMRLFNVYGQRQSAWNPYTGVVIAFVNAVMNDRAPIIFDDGMQTRDFIHVTDVARVLAAAAVSKENATGTWNVGTGLETSVLNLAQTILRIAHSKQVPLLSGKRLSQDIRRSVADHTLTQERFDWHPTVALADGIGDLLRYAPCVPMSGYERSFAEFMRKKVLV